MFVSAGKENAPAHTEYFAINGLGNSFMPIAGSILVVNKILQDSRPTSGDSYACVCVSSRSSDRATRATIKTQLPYDIGPL